MSVRVTSAIASSSAFRRFRHVAQRWSSIDCTLGLTAREASSGRRGGDERPASHDRSAVRCCCEEARQGQRTFPWQSPINSGVIRRQRESRPARKRGRLSCAEL
jgi:hypothetical protein